MTFYEIFELKCGCRWRCHCGGRPAVDYYRGKPVVVAKRPQAEPLAGGARNPKGVGR